MKPKLEALDALRVLSCLAIAGFHAYLLLSGYCALEIFFIMSGFLSAYHGYDEPRMDGAGLKYGLHCALRKIIKLYPVHLIALLFPLAAQLYGVYGGFITPGRVLAKLAANALLLHSWIPVNEFYFSFNVPSWYLSTIMFCYAMLPLIIRVLRRYRSAKTAGLVSVGIYLAQLLSAVLAARLYTRLAEPDALAYQGFWQWFVQVFPVFRLGDFAIGCNLAYIFLTGRERRLSSKAYTALELGALALFAVSEYAYLNSLLPDYISTTSLFAPAAAALVYVFALGRGRVSAALKNRFFRAAAAVSADIYLVHYVVVMACSMLCTRLPLSGAAQKLVFVCLVCTLTLLFALASRHFRALCERKFKKFKLFT